VTDKAVPLPPVVSFAPGQKEVVFRVTNLTVGFPPEADLSRFGKGQKTDLEIKLRKTVSGIKELEKDESEENKIKKKSLRRVSVGAGTALTSIPSGGATAGASAFRGSVLLPPPQMTNNRASRVSVRSNGSGNGRRSLRMSVKGSLPTDKPQQVTNRRASRIGDAIAHLCESAEREAESGAISTSHTAAKDAGNIAICHYISESIQNEATQAVLNDLDADDAEESSVIAAFDLTQDSPQDRAAKITVACNNITLKNPITTGLTVLTGPVGSGKSCFLNSLMGEREILRPDSHNVLGGPEVNHSLYQKEWDFDQEGRENVAKQHHRVLKGMSRTKIERKTTQYGYCPQKSFCISGSVEENVVFGRNISKNEVITALGRACLIYNDVGEESETNISLSTLVGESGVSLSGGQLQRLSLARAWASEPDVVTRLHL